MIIKDNDARESILTAQDDSFRVVEGRQWGMEKHEFNHHLWFPFMLGVLEMQSPHSWREALRGSCELGKGFR